MSDIIVVANANLARRNKDNNFTEINIFGSDTDYTQIDASGNISLVGTAGLMLPHLYQSDSTTQAIADTGLAQVITFDTDSHHYLITRTSSSRFTITKAGSYLIVLKGTADLAVGANKHLEAWLRVNGNDVASSNTRIELVGAIEVPVTKVFVQHFAIGDYFEFWTWGDSTSSQWLATAAGVTPTRPACPSVTLACSYLAGD